MSTLKTNNFNQEEREKKEHTSWCCFFKRKGLGNSIQGMETRASRSNTSWSKNMENARNQGYDLVMNESSFLCYKKNQTCSIFWPTKSWFSPRSSVGLRNIYIITWYRSACEPMHHFTIMRRERYPKRLFKNIIWGTNWYLKKCKLMLIVHP